MTIQELDLHIHYWPGGKNKNANALSRDPFAALFPSISVPDADKPIVQLAAVQMESNLQRAGMTAWKRGSARIQSFFKFSCTWRTVSYQ